MLHKVCLFLKLFLARIPIFFSKKDINDWLSQNGYIFRERIFPPFTALMGWLTQIIHPDSSCKNTVARINALRLEKKLLPSSPLTGGYVQARNKLPKELIVKLAKDTAHKVENSIPKKWSWYGRNVMMVDGSTLFLQDTPTNQKKYPQQKSQKKGCGFPILRVVTVMSLMSGCIHDFAFGKFQGKETGECSLFQKLLPLFKQKDVCLGDGYYGSFFVIALLLLLKVDVVFKIHGARKYDFRKGKRLGKRDHIIRWKKPKKPCWISEEVYISLPEEIELREVEVKYDIAGFRSKTITLVTNFLSASLFSKPKLANLFKRRWYVETCLKNIKDTMAMARLSCKSPPMVEKEIWMYILGYNIICKIINYTAKIYKTFPQQISFKATIQTFLAYTSTWIIENKKYKKNTTYLFFALSKQRIANRPNRVEPRVVKKRQSQYDLLNKTRDKLRKALCNSRYKAN